MIQGIYNGKVIATNPTVIRIANETFELPVQADLNDNLSVLCGFDGKIIFLEKLLETMIDEVTLRNQLDPNFIIPTSGTISSVFGPRRNPIGGGNEFHEGVDIQTEIGAPIAVIDDGIIRKSGEHDIYGLFVVVDHTNGISSTYAHLSEILIEQGHLEQGTIIGKVGSTGKSSGPHLHLGLDYRGKYLNPRAFYSQDKLLLGNQVEMGTN